ncbi:hypothetical protein FA727_13130 [Robertmurraya kyonggiensis]|uniref:Uncharacterized protein n=1 Tax=Robertmurraya kyonggiensis TaxID=1037680 RepID=A0A4U1D3M7_9BACI|nr:hypothetical protein FA727_13130 [Robertmurraya kyonggiensis]
MKEFILTVADIVNRIHDLIMRVSQELGLNLTDKDLHIWVFGTIGIVLFFIVHMMFKKLAKYSVISISFIYTFTVLLVVVFAIEIQQKITGRGEMEFDDAVISIWGYLLFFASYLVIKVIAYYFKKFRRGK